jgi:cystathionine beta-synthase
MVTVEAEQTIGEAMHKMMHFNISQMPVKLGDSFVGSITDHVLLSRLVDEPNLRAKSVSEVMQEPFALVDKDLPVTKLAGLMDKKRGAVLVQIDSDTVQIITNHDIIKALA